MGVNTVNIGQHLESLVEKLAKLNAAQASNSIGFLSRTHTNSDEQNRLNEIIGILHKKVLILDLQTKDVAANQTLLRQTETFVTTLLAEFTHPTTQKGAEELVEQFHDKINGMIDQANKSKKSGPRTR